jgi:hypothetical protein
MGTSLRNFGFWIGDFGLNLKSKIVNSKSKEADVARGVGSHRASWGSLAEEITPSRVAC